MPGSAALSGGSAMEHQARPLSEGLAFHGPSKTLNDAHFLLFSGITGDVHRSHYDVEYAKNTRFGKPLAHGLLLASLTALGASELRDHIEGFVLVEQGCRYLHPATVGDTVRSCFVIQKVWEEGHRKYCKVATRLENQDGRLLLEGFHCYRIIVPGQEEQGHD